MNMEKVKEEHKKKWIDEAVINGFSPMQAEFLYEKCRPSMANVAFPSFL